jgi:hypothetical protein
MRTFLFICLLLCLTTSQAQTFLPGSFIDYNYRGNRFNSFNSKDSALSNKKWSLNKYTAISTSFTGWKGGYATVISAPIGIQLNRAITDNVYAFAGLSIAPSYVNFHQSFMNTNFNKATSNSIFYKPNNFNLPARAEIGIGYTNDEHTFSISGSVGIEKNSYPMQFYVPYNSTVNNNNTPVIK